MTTSWADWAVITHNKLQANTSKKTQMLKEEKSSIYKYLVNI